MAAGGVQVSELLARDAWWREKRLAETAADLPLALVSHQRVVMLALLFSFARYRTM